MRIHIADKITDEIEAIIFDFGGVIMDVDFSKTLDAFANLNIGEIGKKDIIAENGSFFRELELGEITPVEFIDKFRKAYPASKSISEDKIWEAWHALLQPYDNKRIELLKEVGKHYKTYLFSNTNAPHREVFQSMFRKQCGYDMERLFCKCYYSDALHLRKPDPKIYESITNDLGLDPHKILFIDDTAANIIQAEASGWVAYRLTGGETINDIFSV